MSTGLRLTLSRIPQVTPKGVLTQPLRLPAVLDNLRVTEEALFSEFQTIRAGQFAQPAAGPATARQLRKFDGVKTLTVSWDPSWQVQTGIDPDQLRDELKRILRSRKPVNMIASMPYQRRPFIHVDVTFRSVSDEIRGREVDTRYYDIAIAEDRSLRVRRRSSNRKQAKTVTLKAGDTLMSLALDHYDAPEAASDIAGANGLLRWGIYTAIVKHPKFKVGDKIKLPALTLQRGDVLEQNFRIDRNEQSYLADLNGR